MRFLLAILLGVFSLSALPAADGSSGAFSNSLPVMAPVHPLLPFTTRDQLKPCSEYFDEQQTMEESLQCANNEVFNKKPYAPLVGLKAPRCYVITEKSPDVYQDAAFNYITTSIILGDKILGFYENDIPGEEPTIYLVETYDVRKVALHEYQHWFLDLAQKDANARHDHVIWEKCEPPYYTPSEDSIDHYKKTGRNFDLKTDKAKGVKIFQRMIRKPKVLI